MKLDTRAGRLVSSIGSSSDRTAEGCRQALGPRLEDPLGPAPVPHPVQA
jgi:hypothetical protein